MAFDPVTPERKLATNRAYYQRNRERVLKMQQEYAYAPERADRTRERKREWARANRGKARASTTAAYAKLRAQAVEIYGGKCACCGEDQGEFLALDHIDGGGTAHRKQVGTGYTFLRWLRENEWPPMLQVLCHNCNFAKERPGGCPHVRR